MRNISHRSILLLVMFVIAGLAIFEPGPEPMAYYGPSAVLPALAIGGCASTCVGEAA